MPPAPATTAWPWPPRPPSRPADPVFTDNPPIPFLCQPQFGGAIDPSPFIDPVTGNAYLVWKSNDGGSTQPARLWSQQLSANGLSVIGSPHLLLTQDTATFPWETTVENPDMVDVGGTYFLLFSTGQWNSSSYSETYAECAGPAGPCIQSQAAPLLSNTATAAGPGGGSLFQDAAGNWYLGYAAWQPGCTDYSCGGARRLFVAPATISPGSLPTPVTGMASTPTGDGYWLVNDQGGVTGHGDAESYGSMAGHALNAPIEHIVATPDGRGYWLVAADGGTFAFGDAGFYGSMGGIQLNAPVVDITPTADGRGYWLVAADGGIFAFGDAGFHGSMGGQHLNRPVVGISSDYATGGYWEVATDGGIFAFGAPFFGSTGNIVLNHRSTAWRPPLTTRAIGSSPPTGGSSPSGTPASTGRWEARCSTPRSWAWPGTRPPAATGWSDQTVASSRSVRPSKEPTDVSEERAPDQAPAGRVCMVAPAGGETVDAGGLAVYAVRVTVLPPATE